MQLEAELKQSWQARSGFDSVQTCKQGRRDPMISRAVGVNVKNSNTAATGQGPGSANSDASIIY